MLHFDNYSSETVKAKVELFNGSTLVQTCTCSNYLEDFNISRVGDNGKFFGFGVCQSLDINFIDLHSDLTVEKGNTVEVAFGDGTTYWNYPYPTFYLTDVNRDEKNASINATAYDALYKAAELTYKDLNLTVPYTIRDVAAAIARVLGISSCTFDAGAAHVDDSYAKGGNFDGDETLRFVLDAIAEATLTVYYIDSNNNLRFRKLQQELYDDNCDLTVTKNDYYELNVGTKRRLTGICSATELGENYEAHHAVYDRDVTQYIRNNPFWELRTDIAELVESAAANVTGMVNQQFDCDWAGDYRLEIGDTVVVVADEYWVHTYVFNDTITYDGTLNEFTEWEYPENGDTETFANPTNIREVLDKTYAKVDKIEKEITLYVGELVDEAVQGKVDDAIDESLTGIVTDVNNLKATTATHTEKFSQLEMTTSSINAAVSSLQQSNTIISSDIENVKGEQTKIKEDLAEINVTTESISASVSSLETTNTELTKRVTTAEGNIKTLTNSQTETNSKVASLTTSLDGIEGRVETLESTTETSIALEKINEDISTLKTEQTTIKNNVAALQIKDNEITADVSALQSTTTTVTNTLTGVQNEQTTMKQDIAALKVKDTEISASVSGLESTTETLTSDMEGVLSEQTNIKEDIGQLKIEKDKIVASVQAIEETTTSSIESVNNELASISKKAELAVTAEDVSIQISSAIDNGVTTVKTNTGYTFNDEGLHISKSGSNMTSVLNEDGLIVSRHDAPVLEAVSDGVNALNLTARQYLKIGGSRFQAHGTDRTGCFWIGD
jgi:predicted  nucleic acid-binding Zn-ribbon protein